MANSTSDFEIRIHPSDTLGLGWPNITFTGCNTNAQSEVCHNIQGVGGYKSNQDMTAFHIIADTGTIVTGTFSLYGITA